jgi:hypothetical protein
LGLDLKEWAISFDLTCDALTLSKLWAIMSNIPLVFWQEEALISIRNNKGKFISCELGWEMNIDRKWAWVQIEVGMREGLLDEIELVWGGFSCRQKIDYWHVPFRCFGCHEVGHLQTQCRCLTSHFVPFNKIWKRKQSTMDSEKEKVADAT